MSDDRLLFDRHGAVARLTLNRPAVGNTIDIPLAKALFEAAIICDEDPSIRCVLLTGAGRLFCGGGDVGAFAEAGDSFPFFLKEVTAYLHMAVSRLAHMPKPLVTAVNGPAAGAGISLAVLGDIALAASSAHFSIAYPSVGLSPDGGATWLLPRLIGLRRAQEIFLSNRRVDAVEAAAIGLVTRVVEPGSLADEALAVAASLAGQATAALGRIRNLLLGGFDSSLDAHLEAEARAMAESGRGAEAREGVAAFLAKRRPDFA